MELELLKPDHGPFMIIVLNWKIEKWQHKYFIQKDRQDLHECLQSPQICISPTYSLGGIRDKMAYHVLLKKRRSLKSEVGKATIVDREDLQRVRVFCGGQEGDQNPMICLSAMIIRLNTLGCHKMNCFCVVLATQNLNIYRQNVAFLFKAKSCQMNRNRVEEECPFRVKSIALFSRNRVDSTPTPTTMESPSRQRII
ncbi:hypothetical protein EGR_09553 [Echinococcus granulosus]|uniref:Uncharacterized protein n=1 Tax=Echinococcus granulosus TaxID=6210 RepID=W6UQB4_ECHGR|nr:hypothetical protein EGR_09553 [Echinococcus granulosus]EUB55574.1 hypothetical protein EGR_09553 [Echinococcus granulosus]